MTKTLQEVAAHIDALEIKATNGVTIGRIGIKIMLKFERQTDIQQRENLMQIVNRFRAWVGPEKFGWWASSVTGKVHLERKKKFDAEALFAKGRNPNREFDVAMTSVEDPDMEAEKVGENAQRFMIHFFTREMEKHLGYLEMHVPLPWVLEQASDKKLMAWLHDCCELLQPIHGTLGLAVLLPTERMFNRHERYAQAIRPYLVAMPGLQCDTPSGSGPFGDGIFTVNWLTVVHDQWLEKLGGRRAVQSACVPPLKAHPWTHGLIIQAGDDPGLGDPAQPEFGLPAYFAAARLLRPIRVTRGSDLVISPPLAGASPDWLTDGQHWLERFDRPYIGTPAGKP